MTLDLTRIRGLAEKAMPDPDDATVSHSACDKLAAFVRAPPTEGKSFQNIVMEWAKPRP